LSWRNSPLPKEVILNQVAVPTSPTAVTGVAATQLFDIEHISLTNTTGASITFTLTDGSDNPIANLNAYPIDPNTPYIFEFFDPPERATGLKWTSGGAGLVANVRGWKQIQGTAISGIPL
jgi:hypothetical protein